MDAGRDQARGMRAGRDRDMDAGCASRARQAFSSLALNEMVRGVSMPSNSTS